MKFAGKELILDNFRKVLKDYSVDVQDVVRSAILDGVDISLYIKQCKDNPYRLDQIRLAMKEGMGSFFYTLNGESLFQIRKMNQSGVDLKDIEKQLECGLSDEHIEYLLKWVNDGISLTGLTLGYIPKNLLSVFDMGLHNDIDMSIYNNGKSYSSDFIRNCIQIQKNGCSVLPLLEGNWNDSVVSLLSKRSGYKVSNWWDSLMANISCNDPWDRVVILVDLAVNKIPLKVLQAKVNGEYKYNNECLSIILEGYKSNVSIEELLTETNPNKMRTKFEELKLKRKRKISGTLVRYPSEPK